MALGSKPTVIKKLSVTLQAKPTVTGPSMNKTQSQLVSPISDTLMPPAGPKAMNMTAAANFTTPKSMMVPEDAKTVASPAVLETRNVSSSLKKIKKENNNLPPITAQTNGSTVLKPKSGSEKIVKKVEIKLRDTS